MSNEVAGIHSGLDCYTYKSTRDHVTTLTKTVGTSVAGAITGYVGAYGDISISQAPSEVKYHQENDGFRTDRYALFVNSSGNTVEFSIDAPLPEQTKIYLWMKPGCWIYQYGNMSEPKVVFGRCPQMGFSTIWFPYGNVGSPYSDPQTQQQLKVASFDLREFLTKIGKDTPRTFASAEKLQAELDKDKNTARAKYNSSNYPDLRDRSSGLSGRIQHIWKKYKTQVELKVGKFLPKMKIKGQWNNIWLGASLLLGTFCYMSTTIFYLLPFHAFSSLKDNAYQYFGLFGLIGVWLLYVLFFMLVLQLFLNAKSKAPFKYDETYFFKIINLPFHTGLDLGFNSGKNKNRIYGGALVSDAALEDNYLMHAHDAFEFNYKTFEELESNLQHTKLTVEEKKNLISAVMNQPLPL